MADSMYDGGGEDAEDTAMPNESESKESDSGEETALLPKSFFGGKEIKPGSKCEIEIVHGYDDEVEVKYVPHSDKEESKDESMTMNEEPSMKDKIAMAAT